MGLRALVWEPLQGKTSLSRVFWIYGVLGSVLVSAVELGIDPTNVLELRAYVVFGLLFSLYVTVATYQCAANCQSKLVAQLARISAVISLLALPIIAYYSFHPERLSWLTIDTLG